MFEKRLMRAALAGVVGGILGLLAIWVAALVAVITYVGLDGLTLLMAYDAATTWQIAGAVAGALTGVSLAIATKRKLTLGFLLGCFALVCIGGAVGFRIGLQVWLIQATADTESCPFLAGIGMIAGGLLGGFIASRLTSPSLASGEVNRSPPARQPGETL